MTKNENSLDRVIRVILGLILIYVGWVVLDNNLWGLILDIIGLILLITGLVGSCPVYKALGINTCKECAPKTETEPEKPQAPEEAAAPAPELKEEMASSAETHSEETKETPPNEPQN